MSNLYSIKDPLLSLFDDINNNHETPDLFNNSLDSTSSILSNKDNPDENYHFYCINCKTIPILNFYSNYNIKYICKCKQELISIQKIFDFLYYSEENDNKNLKCKYHHEKYNYYCPICFENLCFKCTHKCTNNHIEQDIKYIGFNTNAVDKIQYIKIKEEKDKNLDDITIDTYMGSDENTLKERIIDDNDFGNDTFAINIGNSEQLLDKDDYIKKLFKIILFDFDNYPNCKQFKTISNLERFATFYFKDYNEINLHYAFNEENIKNKKVELFGEKFVNNNKENCFLIINENIIELEREINLENIFEKVPIKLPIHLDIQLIERKRKIMTDLSFMFNEISTITHKSNFDNYDTSKVRNMSYMFYNCKLLNLPNFIEKFNTKNVIDMSYMFFNCSLLKQIPDISNWDIGKLIKTNNMFANCSSLTSLPKISNWNIKNIKQMNYMFKNCKLLINLPDTLKWNIGDDVETLGICEGINLQKDNKDNFVLRFSKKLVNNIICCLYNIFCNHKLINCLKYLFKIHDIFGKLTLALIFLISPIYSVYNSYKLDESRECIENPLNYFNITNFTDINFTYKCLNIINSTKKDEIFENKEKCISSLLNFTSINGNVKFETTQFYNKLFSILVLIFFISIVINLLIICSDLRKDPFNYKKEFIHLILIVFFILTSLIFGILDCSFIFKLKESFIKLDKNTEKLFNKDFSEFERNENINLELSFVNIYLSFFLLIFLPLSINAFLIEEKKYYNKLENRVIKRNRHKDKSLLRIFIEIAKNSFIYQFLSKENLFIIDFIDFIKVNLFH